MTKPLAEGILALDFRAADAARADELNAKANERLPPAISLRLALSALYGAGSLPIQPKRLRNRYRHDDV
jgi:hypothetical protein